MMAITAPLAYQVFQRNTQGNALFTVAGTCPPDTTSVRCRLTPVRGGQGVDQTIAAYNGLYSADLLVSAGWYQLLVQGVGSDALTQTATLERVGVGEVFIVGGHSVAQGDGAHTLPGSLDERVVTLPLTEPAGTTYAGSGLAADLPTVYAPYFSGVRAAPFGSSTHFWAKFGEQVATGLNVPVLLLNAAFGGTNLEMWSKSARGEAFVHSFVKSDKRFPYINLKNALTKYAGVTGCRAILVDHGQNDTGEPDGARLLSYYKDFVAQARLDAGAPGLAVVVNRQTPYRTAAYIRTMQEAMATQPGCFPGPDYDALLVDAVDRYDGIHLNESGMAKAAAAWAAVVMAAPFQSSARPYQARQAPLLPVPTPAPTAFVPVSVEADPFLTASEGPVALNLSFVAGAVGMVLLLALAWLAFQFVTARPQTT